MTGEGIVTETNGNVATVKIKRSSACGHDCGECNLCKNPDIEVKVLNPLGAAVGSRVKLGTDTGKVLKDAFLLYMLPIIGAFVLYIVLSSFNAVSWVCIAAEILWFVLWLVFIRHHSKNNVSMSIIVEVLN